MDQITLDDRDPHITYFGNWTYGGTGQEYWGTTSGANATNMSMMFTFNGTWIGVYGSIGFMGVTADFVLDNGEAEQYLHTPAPSGLFRQAYFESTPLAFGEHTIQMTNMANGPTSYLDYIVYNTTAQSGSTTTVTSLVTATSIPGTAPSKPSNAPYKAPQTVKAIPTFAW
ncbi:hypothetical protein GLOTRDRAFT_93590 [Gloeophyllum trabeum ATCC 11539]|uniref:Uncharacterized protein n=1 Tax=Gloeophyllum trabeum (strain ATCC 11539 / FP-39264 / Madison 617) TaxID=670483 RepID=S7RQ50_GLOTA|nr:uncharacterized protein GLOTRDRAFT_93590 [Gloeophyllum trabeum ATCC 11539]EPQ55009.1 hypothetical protein GLOTRDRAFT_93590 [Gloeophyllum trabeum ATCC 11539]